MANGENFRKRLAAELSRRKKLDRKYSNRLFAEDLGIDFSFLAKLLNGSRSFTPLTLRRLAPKLGLSTGESELYLEDILQKQVRQRKVRQIRARVRINSVTPERFSLISEWYYTAILVLMTFKGFDPRPSWIAKQLGISTYDAAQAMLKMEKQGYFYRNEKGKCVIAARQNSVQPTVDTTLELKHYLKQTLFKSISALDSVDLKMRDHSCITVATTTKRIEQAKPIIRAFRRKLMKFLENVESPNVVYDFENSLFPLTNEIVNRS